MNKNQFVTESRQAVLLNGESVDDRRGTYDLGGSFRELEYGEVSVMGFSTKPEYITIENTNSREGHPLEDAKTIAEMIVSMQEWLQFGP